LLHEGKGFAKLDGKMGGESKPLKLEKTEKIKRKNKILIASIVQGFHLILIVY
jgi:hypothetical protein